MRKKEVLKWIKKESKKLPDMYYEAYHKYTTPRIENVAKEGEEEQLESITGYVQKHKVNHKRRIWRVYKKHGFQELQRYFALYGFGLTENKESPE